MFFSSMSLRTGTLVALRSTRNHISALGLTFGFGVTALALAAQPAAPPRFDLPAGLELVVAAAPPLVNFPILGCLDDRGRLFLGDSPGVNLDKQQLEAQQPGRILVLEDLDGDGIFDQSRVFADKFTYPSGGVWLDGSLYFASPPGIWKLTDTNGDSVADQRELLVGGFDGYNGNGTHVHSPIFNPDNGRIYWCAGGTGGTVVQKDGTLVRNGRITGIWSCRPDGSDIRVHALGAMANPVEADFTADGEILGVMNILYSQPRGDTLLHWREGGVYERVDPIRRGRHSGLAGANAGDAQFRTRRSVRHDAVSLGRPESRVEGQSLCRILQHAEGRAPGVDALGGHVHRDGARVPEAAQPMDAPHRRDGGR
jgi:hypothetical protein